MRSFWSGFVYRGVHAAAALLAAGAAVMPACAPQPGAGRIRLEALEMTAETLLGERVRAVVCDPERVAPLLLPISERVALLEIRTAEDWETLAAGSSTLGPRPDFNAGAFVAIVSRIGQPVDGVWPCHVEDVRVLDGTGLVSATLRGGTYLPDGTTCLEGVYVTGLRRVRAVQLNGDRYFVR